jgi:hypothetical protein
MRLIFAVVVMMMGCGEATPAEAPQGTGGRAGTGGFTATGGAAGEPSVGDFWDDCAPVSNSAYAQCPELAERMAPVLPVVPPICPDGLLRCTFRCVDQQRELLCISLGGECSLPGSPAGCQP